MDMGKRMNRRQAGLTLIELMITVSIVAVLAALVLPLYTEYRAKAKVAEVLMATSPCRTTVTEGYQSASTSPGANAWGCETTTSNSRYVGAITTTDDGIITVMTSSSSDLPAALQGKTLRLMPTDANGTPMTFTPGATVGGFACEPVTMPAKYLPGACHS